MNKGIDSLKNNMNKILNYYLGKKSFDRKNFKLTFNILYISITIIFVNQNN